MPRPPRIHLPGGFYHVTLRGNHREAIFQVDSDRSLLNTIVQAAIEKHDVRVHAYCWMTNHLHLMVQVGTDPLANFMRRVASGYARAFQASRLTTGHLFEKRYHAILVEEDAYLLELVRYIHMNPVRANLVPRVGEYRWSSHHAYSGVKVDSWVTTGFALNMFSADRSRAATAYRRFVALDPSQVPSPFSALAPDEPAVLGSDAFITRVMTPLVPASSRVTLESLIEAACARFGLRPDQLVSRMRNQQVAAARAWITRRGISERVASITAIARRLGCDTNTLRHAMRRFDEDHEAPPQNR
jgi:REP-associated tyrosine transposase